MPSPCLKSSLDQPKIKFASKKKSEHKKKVESDFPLNTTTCVTSPTIPIFGSSTTSVTVPFPTSFCSTTPEVVAVVSGTCGGPLVFGFAITGPSSAVTGTAATVVFTVTCVDGVATAAFPAFLPAPISPAPTITISGLPIIGAAPGSVSSNDPVATQVCVRSEKCSALISGLINETITFCGVVGNLSDAALAALAAALLEALFAPLLTGPCGAATLAALGIPAGVGTPIPTIFPGITAASPLSALVAAILATLEPDLIARLRAALVGSSPLITQTVPPFPFAVAVSDPAIEKVEKCDKLCADVCVSFAKAVGAPLPVSSLPTSFTISVTSSCSSIIPTGTPLTFAITTADLLGGISPSLVGATTLPSVICANTGVSCVPASPAVIKTDKLNIIVNHGKACECPPDSATSVNLLSSGTHSPLSFFPGSTFFPGSSSRCSTC